MADQILFRSARDAWKQARTEWSNFAAAGAFGGEMPEPPEFPEP